MSGFFDALNEPMGGAPSKAQKKRNKQRAKAAAVAAANKPQAVEESLLSEVVEVASEIDVVEAEEDGEGWNVRKSKGSKTSSVHPLSAILFDACLILFLPLRPQQALERAEWHPR